VGPPFSSRFGSAILSFSRHRGGSGGDAMHRSKTHQSSV
jgi:hypothetical protein